MNRSRYKIIIIAILLLLFLACNAATWESDLMSGGMTPTPHGDNTPWSAEQCNAISELHVELTSFDELEVVEDGDLLSTECDYVFTVSVPVGNNPVRLVYFKGFDYGEFDSNSDESGWRVTPALQPGDSWQLPGSVSQAAESWFITEERPMYINITYNIAAIAYNKHCDWLTDGGVHEDILEIAAYDKLDCPCKLISPYGTAGYGSIRQDMKEGLIGD